VFVSGAVESLQVNLSPEKLKKQKYSLLSAVFSNGYEILCLFPANILHASNAFEPKNINNP